MYDEARGVVMKWAINTKIENERAGLDPMDCNLASGSRPEEGCGMQSGRQFMNHHSPTSTSTSQESEKEMEKEKEKAKECSSEDKDEQG